jgi:hypothetical protein
MKILLIALLFPVIGMGQAVGGGKPTGPVPGLTVSETPLDRFVFCACPKYNQYFRVSGEVSKSYDSTGLCNHIYVAVESEEIKTEWASTGIKSKQIVCVKCHKVTAQRQVMAYIGGGSGGMAIIDSKGRVYLTSPSRFWSTDTLSVCETDQGYGCINDCIHQKKKPRKQ